VDDISEETRDADGIYVVLQDHRWGEISKYCWSFTWEWAAFCHKVAGRLYCLLRTAVNWWGRLVYFMSVWTQTATIC